MANTPRIAPTTHADQPLTRRPRRQDRTILLVQDDPVTLEVFERILSRRGYRVTTARDGLQAMHALDRAQPDLLILDLYLALLPGADLLRRLRATGRAMPAVLVFTAETEQRSAQVLGDYRPDGWIQKPCRARDLLGHVQALLS